MVNDHDDVIYGSILHALMFDFQKAAPAIFSKLSRQHMKFDQFRVIFSDAETAFANGKKFYDILDARKALKNAGFSSKDISDVAEWVDKGFTPRNLDGLCEQIIDIYNREQLSQLLREASSTEADLDVHSRIERLSMGLTGLSRGESGSITVADYADKVIALTEGKNGLEPRFDDLGFLFDFHGMVVLAARPSVGKTTFAMNQADYWISRYIPGGVYSLEMPGEDLLMREAASRIGVPFFKFLKGAATPEELAKLREELEELKRLPLYIRDQSYTINELCASMATEAENYGWKWIVIDYLQLLKETPEELRRDRNSVTANWSKSIKNVQKKLGIPVILVSQLSRAGFRNKEDTPPPPTIEALRDSGQIEQDADAIIFLYKRPGIAESEFENNPVWEVYCEVAKQRNGPTGTVQMMFDRKKGMYYTESQYKALNGLDKGDEVVDFF